MSRFLFRIARLLSRSRVTGALVGFTFRHLSAFLPVRRVRETHRVTCFHHPRPSFRDHLLVVPKRAFTDLPALLSPDACPWWTDLLESARITVDTWGWSAYSFGVNAGAYQDVAQVHFHLYGEACHWRPTGAEAEPEIVAGRLRVARHPDPVRAVHLILDVDDGSRGGFADDFRSVVDRFGIADGYTVFCDLERTEPLRLQLVAGENLT